MAGMQDQWDYKDHFFGAGTLSTVGQGDDWVITDTSAAGTPTYAKVDGSSTGEIALDHSSTVEVQNVCLSFGDVLCFDIDKLKGFEWRVKQNQATIDAATSIAFGMTGDRNDAIDSIAQNCLFRLIGANDVVVETDDGTTDNDDVATGQILTNAYKFFKVDFSAGKSDIKFYMGDTNGALKRVARGTTFSMAAYTGSLQPLVQLQKTSDANEDGVTLDYFHAWGIL